MEPRVLIVGPSRCGKDHAGEWFEDFTPWKYGGTTSLALCPYVAAEMGMTEAECYAVRHQHRQVWYEMGNRLRQESPGFLLRKMLEQGPIVAGVRDYCEIKIAVAHGMITDLVWIENPRCSDPTLKFTREQCEELCRRSHNVTNVTFHVIQNTGTLDEYERNLRDFAKAQKWLIEF